MKKVLLFLSILAAANVFAACQRTATEQPAAAIAETAAVKSVTVEQARAAVATKDVQFIDVRTPAEYGGGHAVKAVNMPLDTLETDLAKLDRNRPVYVICQTGRRSQSGAELLRKNGFTELYNVEGGTSAWTAAGLETEK